MTRIVGLPPSLKLRRTSGLSICLVLIVAALASAQRGEVRLTAFAQATAVKKPDSTSGGF